METSAVILLETEEISEIPIVAICPEPLRLHSGARLNLLVTKCTKTENGFIGVSYMLLQVITMAYM